MIESLLALGGNIGNISQHIDRAENLLNNHSDIKVLKRSSLYGNPALLKQNAPPQDPFINAALLIQTTLKPIALLTFILDIELKCGRERPITHLHNNNQNNQEKSWQPRTLDIDIITYGGYVFSINKPLQLDIPHIDTLNRGFVLKPCAEIAPKMMIPRAQKVILNKANIKSISGAISVEMAYHDWQIKHPEDDTKIIRQY